MKYVLKTIGSAFTRTRRENSASKRQRKSYGFNGEVKEGKRIKRFVSQGCAQLSQVKEKRSPLRLNVSGQERQRRVLPGIQEHENRVQLSLGKGCLIGNESEI